MTSAFGFAWAHKDFETMSHFSHSFDRSLSHVVLRFGCCTHQGLEARGLSQPDQDYGLRDNR